jgi:hypothetical protein
MIGPREINEDVNDNLRETELCSGAAASLLSAAVCRPDFQLLYLKPQVRTFLRSRDRPHPSIRPADFTRLRSPEEPMGLHGLPGKRGHLYFEVEA